MATITTTQNVNPADLLVDVNVRTDLRLDKDFVGSIAEHGVLSPIVAVATDDGLRVRMGHRRTAAAIEAGLDSVPVVVIDPVAAGDADTIERLLTQHAENHHRAGLTTSENAQVVHQLSLLGLSPTQIAKRTRTKKAHVDAGIKVAGSELASKATDRYDLTLDQAVAVAEFDDDPEAVKTLVVAAKEGRFEHVAQRLRDQRAEAEAKAPILQALADEGLTVIDPPGYSDTAVSLTRLVDSDGNDLDPHEHRSCEGHAVYLTEREVYTEPDGTVLDANRWGDVDWPEDNQPADDEEAERRWEAVTVTSHWVPQPACIDFATHGHRDRWNHTSSKPTADEMSPEEREAAKAARRLVIDNNKAWKAARQVRREWIKTYLTRKTLPPAAGPFLATALVREPDLTADRNANDITAEWFGVEASTYGRSQPLTDLAVDASDKRALVIVLGAVLAGYEARAGDNAWRENGEHSPTGRYLRILTTLGYTLSEVEEYAASDQSA